MSVSVVDTSIWVDYFKGVENRNLIDCDFSHWERVGDLRSSFARKGITISTPDADIAQCCLDLDCLLMTKDNIFKQITKVLNLVMLS